MIQRTAKSTNTSKYVSNTIENCDVRAKSQVLNDVSGVRDDVDSTAAGPIEEVLGNPWHCWRHDLEVADTHVTGRVHQEHDVKGTAAHCEQNKI